MSKHRRTPERQCAACQTHPVTDTTICRPCGVRLEVNLGDIAALADAVQRVFSSDDRSKGNDDTPLIRSRVRRTVPKVDPVTRSCPVNPLTGGPVYELEQLDAGQFGRSPVMPWELEHGLAADVDVTLARQGVIGRDSGAHTTGDKPVPYHDRAGQVRREAHVRLTGWVHAVHDGREPWPGNDLAPASRWLLARIARIVVHPEAARCEADVWRSVRDLRGVVDRPADRWYAGPCDGTVDDGPCVEEISVLDNAGRTVRSWRPTELFAVPESTYVRCRRCGSTYDVAERRRWLLDAVQDQLAHAELIGRAAPTLGVEITPEAVRGYAHRKRIVAHGTDLRGRPLYRIGDVIDVARDVLAKRAERSEGAAKKAAEKAAKQRRSA